MSHITYPDPFRDSEMKQVHNLGKSEKTWDDLKRHKSWDTFWKVEKIQKRFKKIGQCRLKVWIYERKVEQRRVNITNMEDGSPDKSSHRVGIMCQRTQDMSHPRPAQNVGKIYSIFFMSKTLCGIYSQAVLRRPITVRLPTGKTWN